MAKTITFCLLLYLGIALCVGILAGGGGYAITSLTAAVDEDDVILEVTSTSGFLSSDYVEFGGEKTLYTDKTATTFTGCIRGCEGTTAEDHPVGTGVYTTSAHVINSALGFSIGATVDTMGLWSIIVIPTRVLLALLGTLIMPYQLFRNDLVIFAAVLALIEAGIFTAIALAVLGARRV